MKAKVYFSLCFMWLTEALVHNSTSGSRLREQFGTWLISDQRRKRRWQTGLDSGSFCSERTHHLSAHSTLAWTSKRDKADISGVESVILPQGGALKVQDIQEKKWNIWYNHTTYIYCLVIPYTKSSQLEIKKLSFCLPLPSFN